jgi:MFS family permease
VFGAASIAGGLTDTAGQLIVARCFMGLGAAIIFPTTLSLISNAYTERAERAKAIGLWGATAGIAIALGPIVGGGLLEQFRWTSTTSRLPGSSKASPRSSSRRGRSGTKSKA